MRRRARTGGMGVVIRYLSRGRIKHRILMEISTTFRYMVRRRFSPRRRIGQIINGNRVTGIGGGAFKRNGRNHTSRGRDTARIEIVGVIIDRLDGSAFIRMPRRARTGGNSWRREILQIAKTACAAALMANLYRLLLVQFPPKKRFSRRGLS